MESRQDQGQTLANHKSLVPGKNLSLFQRTLPTASSPFSSPTRMKPPKEKLLNEYTHFRQYYGRKAGLLSRLDRMRRSGRRMTGPFSSPGRKSVVLSAAYGITPNWLLRLRLPVGYMLSFTQLQQCSNCVKDAYTGSTFVPIAQLSSPFVINAFQELPYS